MGSGGGGGSVAHPPSPTPRGGAVRISRGQGGGSGSGGHPPSAGLPVDLEQNLKIADENRNFRALELGCAGGGGCCCGSERHCAHGKGDIPGRPHTPTTHLPKAGVLGGIGREDQKIG